LQRDLAELPVRFPAGLRDSAFTKTYLISEFELRLKSLGSQIASIDTRRFCGPHSRGVKAWALLRSAHHQETRSVLQSTVIRIAAVVPFTSCNRFPLGSKTLKSNVPLYVLLSAATVSSSSTVNVALMLPSGLNIKPT